MFKVLLILLLGAVLLLPQGAAGKGSKGGKGGKGGHGAKGRIELTGFLAGLDANGQPLPPTSIVPAQIDVQIDRGGASMLSLPINFTPQTVVDLGTGVVNNGELVEVKLLIENGGLTVKKIREPKIGKFFGTLDLSQTGALTLPVSTDQIVTLLLFGSATLPIQFAITPTTDTDLQTLSDGDQVRVELSIVGGQLVATEIEDKLVRRFKSKGIIANFLAGATCTDTTFDLNGFPVTTASNTRYKNGSCADLATGVEVEAKGVTMPDGTNLATKVKIKGAGVQAAGDFEVKGIISSLTGACPATTFSLSGFVVKTDVNTQYTDGSCATLATGVEVEAEGVTQPDGTNLATEVEIEAAAQAPANFAATGSISGFSGTTSCPAATFEVGGLVVTTDSTTTYTGGTNPSCDDLADGVNVEATGVTQSDGTNLATSVEIRFVVTGSISSFSGTTSCPTTTFEVGGLVVTTDSTTTYTGATGASCDDLVNGMNVEVTGVTQPDGTTNLATDVEFVI